MSDEGYRALPLAMRTKPKVPPGPVATPSQVRKMTPTYKKMHTCWYCKNVYISSTHTTVCEQDHEALESRHA